MIARWLARLLCRASGEHALVSYGDEVGCVLCGRTWRVDRRRLT